MVFQSDLLGLSAPKRTEIEVTQKHEVDVSTLSDAELAALAKVQERMGEVVDGEYTIVD
jgi:hypothetical protein